MSKSRIEDMKSTTFGGRRFTRKQIADIQETVNLFQTLSRRELAHTVCEHLQWYTPSGENKIQACLRMLDSLEDQGVLELPKKLASTKRGRQKEITRTDHAAEQPAIDGKLGQLTPISLQVVTSKEDASLWNEYVDRHHYLGYRQPIGPHLRYFILDNQQRKLGCLLFSYATKSLKSRDEWIGWQKKTYKKHLNLIVNNNRFLIFPWINVKNLASKALSLAAKQLADDWDARHGYKPVLFETFVDSTKFNATCYRAANWKYLGQTKGRAPTKKTEGKTEKAIYVYPLTKNAKNILINGHDSTKKTSKKFKPGNPKVLTSSDPFVLLWKNIINTVTMTANDFDAQWQKRKRTLNTLLISLFVFRLVFSKNKQGYGTTISELWDQCRIMGIPLPQETPVMPSAFCTARAKLDENFFIKVHKEILKDHKTSTTKNQWKGHEIFAVDGSRMNLPRQLIKQGYRIPSDNAHYPQGLLSCLYQLKSKIPVDFNLVSHGNERKMAMAHLASLSKNDVVVYDRGYFSYALLHEHARLNVHAVFRIRNKASSVIDNFIASEKVDDIVAIACSTISRDQIRQKEPQADCQSIRLRLIKYTVAGTTYILGTTLLNSTSYSIQELSDIYHSRWGVEELYKISKQLMEIEDFHAQSERGVKQELYAHFILITLTRIFSNHSEAHFDNQNIEGESTETKANFKNALVTVARNIEGLLLQQVELVSKTVNSIIASISSCRQKQRPNRSYDRRSRKPIGKWKPPKPAKVNGANVVALAPQGSGVILNC